jgi:hypothetical protein
MGLSKDIQKLKEEAARFGISAMLIQISNIGRDYEPWLTEYDDRWRECTTGQEKFNFKIMDKPYTLTLNDLGYPVIGEQDAQQVLMTLERLGKIFYEARIERSGSGRLFCSGKSWEVLAYLPGNWVEEFKEALEKVDQKREEEHFKEQHSPKKLDDLRKRFGL